MSQSHGLAEHQMGEMKGNGNMGDRKKATSGKVGKRPKSAGISPHLPKVEIPTVVPPKVTAPELVFPKVTIPKVTIPQVTPPSFTPPKLSHNPANLQKPAVVAAKTEEEPVTQAPPPISMPPIKPPEIRPPEIRLPNLTPPPIRPPIIQPPTLAQNPAPETEVEDVSEKHEKSSEGLGELYEN